MKHGPISRTQIRPGNLNHEENKHKRRQKASKSSISRTIRRRIVLEKEGFGVIPGRKVVVEWSLLRMHKTLTQINFFLS